MNVTQIENGRDIPKTPRLRFAPSPTGFMHIGGYRTILWNWLYTRQQSGTFIIRIEDTDIERYVPEAVDFLFQGIQWLGLNYDEGVLVGGPFAPYRQTERKEIYSEYAQQLIESGHAYTCYCTESELSAKRKDREDHKLPPRYDRTCRYLTLEQRAEKAREGRIPVIRLAIPLEGEITVHDQLHGDTTFKNANLDDTVLLKSDGLPTYHLAALIDDHLMQISHVLRGDDWYSSYPIHVHLYNAFGWDIPKFYHLPNMLRKDGKKLSKRKGRDGGAPTWVECREEGILPEALRNFLLLQGWAYDDKTELFSLDEMIRVFDLSRIGTSGAIYDEDKLYWMNGVYIRALSPDELLERTIPYMERPASEGGLPDVIARPLDRDYTKRALQLEQERLKTLGESADMLAFFYEEQFIYDHTLLEAINVESTLAANILLRTINLLSSMNNEQWNAEQLEKEIRMLGTNMELKPKQFLGTLRIAVSNRPSTPPLWAVMGVFGKERTLRHLQAMLDTVAEKKL